jgi:hypothetical protein
MRIFLILCWLTLPVLAWAYHLGPGQERVQLDAAQVLLTQASYAAQHERHDVARQNFSEALAKLPSDKKNEGFVIRLGLANAQVNSGQLPEANASLESLMTELGSEASVDQTLVNQVRAALASSQYHMTWLMRLEGLPAADWEPQIEAARQNYRLLAEQAEAKGDDGALETNRHDLESAIRLARMDLSELQGLKIPKQCSGCCSGQCKKPSKKQSKKKSEKKGGGSNLGPLPDGSGS